MFLWVISACHNPRVSEGPTVHRLRLGRELRRARDRAGLSRDDVAGFLERTGPTVSKIETGKMTLPIAEVKGLLNFLGVSDEAETDRILAIAREARKRSAQRVPEWLREYVGLEAEAVEIRDFQIDLVPSLFHTEGYIRAIAAAFEPASSSSDADTIVAIRRERQARLAGQDPPQLHAVVHEAALRVLVGDEKVMREQLTRMLELAELPHVTLQVLANRAGAHASMGRAFTILRLPEPLGGEVAYTEDLWSANYAQKPDQVSAYSRVFGRITGMALDEQGTRAAIEGVVRELS